MNDSLRHRFHKTGEHLTRQTSQFFSKKPWSIPILLTLPLACMLILFYAVPVLIMGVTGFLNTDDTGAILFSITLSNFTKFFGDNWYLLTLVRSVRIAFFVTLFTVSLGYMVAYFLAYFRPRYFEFFLILVISPILVGNVVRAFGWQVLMGENGVINSILIRLGLMKQALQFLYTERGIIIADTSVLLPLVIMILLGVLSRVDASYIEAAKSLGANSLRAFLFVTLPLSLPGIGAASVICFTLALGTFETAIFIGGRRVQMVAPLVYEQIGKIFNWPFGAAISVVILVVSIGGILLNDRLMRGYKA